MAIPSSPEICPFCRSQLRVPISMISSGSGEPWPAWFTALVTIFVVVYGCDSWLPIWAQVMLSAVFIIGGERWTGWMLALVSTVILYTYRSQTIWLLYAIVGFLGVCLYWLIVIAAVLILGLVVVFGSFAVAEGNGKPKTIDEV